MNNNTEQNVKIPLALLRQAIDLLENIGPRNTDNFDQSVLWDYETVLSAFRKKKASLDLRQTYAGIIFAEDEDKRFDARMRYLKEKRELNDSY